MNDKVKDSAIQVTTTILDFFLSNKGMPPLGTMSIQGFSFFKDTLDSFTTRKFEKFFAGDQADFEKLDKKIKSDSSGFWEQTFLAITKMDREEKAEIGNRLLKALCNDDIDMATFQNIVSTLERSFLNDLHALRSQYIKKDQLDVQKNFQGEIVHNRILYDNTSDNDFQIMERLAYSGLLIKYPKGQKSTMDMGEIIATFEYVFSDLGLKLAKHGFSR